MFTNVSLTGAEWLWPAAGLFAATAAQLAEFVRARATPTSHYACSPRMGAADATRADFDVEFVVGTDGRFATPRRVLHAGKSLDGAGLAAAAAVAAARGGGGRGECALRHDLLLALRWGVW